MLTATFTFEIEALSSPQKKQRIPWGSLTPKKKLRTRNKMKKDYIKTPSSRRELFSFPIFCKKGKFQFKYSPPSSKVLRPFWGIRINKIKTIKYFDLK